VKDDSGQPGGSATIAGGMVKITKGLDALDQLGFFNTDSLTAAGWARSGDAVSGSLIKGAVEIRYAYDAATGTITLTTQAGAASKGDYTEVMQRIGFVSTGDDPTASSPTRTLIWRVKDNLGAESQVTSAQTTLVRITAVNDAPTITPATGGTVTFTEGGSPVKAAPVLTTDDADDSAATGATVEITGNAHGDDLLAIAGSALAGTGISLDASSTATRLVLVGQASRATYENVLRQITFSNSSADPAGSGGTRTLSWSITDDFGSRETDFPVGNDADLTKLTSVTATSTITIAPRNDAPTVSGLPGSAASYTEGGSAAVLAGSIALGDVDDANLSGAQVWISGGFTAGDTLSYGILPGGVTASYNGVTGLLTFSGAASRADYATLLNSVKFSSSSADPTAAFASREISWQVTDADASTAGADKLPSATGTSRVEITAVDTPAQLSGLPANTDVTFTEKGSAVAVAPNAVLSDADDTTLEGLVVTIGAGRSPGDVLAVTADLADSGITTSFNAATGTLTLSGHASLADYQAVLRSVVFSNGTDNPTGNGATRTLNWSLVGSFGSRLGDASGANDGDAGVTTANAGSSQINIAARNDAPTLSFGHNANLDAGTVVFEQDGSEVFVLDASNPNTVGSATLADVDDNYISSASVTISGNRGTGDILSVATPAGWTRSGNELTTSGGAKVQVAYNSATGTLTLTTSSGQVTKAEFESLLEHVQYKNSTTSPTASGASRQLTWTVTDANAAGDGAKSVSATSFLVIRDRNDAPEITPASTSVTYTEGDIEVDLPNLTVDDPDPDEIVTATLTLSHPEAGVLTVVPGAHYDADTGVWTFTGSVADVNAALALVKFIPEPNNDVNVTVSLAVADGGEDGAAVAHASIAVNVTAVNDAPELTPANPVLPGINEDATSNNGATVGSFRGTVHDVDTGTQPGIAITGLTSGNGHWEYQVAGGAWTAFPAGLAETQAVLLADTDRVRFVPNGENATTATFTYRAWDGSTGHAGDVVDASHGGNSEAFSNASDQASIVVTAVNDAPVLDTDAPVLTSLTEDERGSAGHSVSEWLVGMSDVDGGALQGMAITGLNSGNGAWEYSTDGGGTWHAVGTVSEDSALLLRDTDKVRFVPDGKNETTASFTYRAWDRSTGSAGGHADTSANGGDTAFSTGRNTASIVVTPVNDAPVNDVLPTIAGEHRGDGTLRQDSVIRVDPGQWHDVDLGDPATSYRYQWQIADDAGGTGLRDIPGATGESFDLAGEHIGKFIRLKVVGSDGKEDVIAYSGFTKVTNIDPVPSTPLVTRETTESVPIRFTLPDDAFVDGDIEDTLHYSATLADGRPLPAWLTFDPATRTFSGTPSGLDVGEIKLRVTADDRGNAPAQAEFTLRVLSIPVKSDPPVKFETGGGAGGTTTLPESSGLPGGMPGIPGTGPGLPGIPGSGQPGGGQPGGGGWPSGLPGDHGGNQGNPGAIPSVIELPGSIATFGNSGDTGTSGGTGTPGDTGTPGGGTNAGSGDGGNSGGDRNLAEVSASASDNAQGGSGNAAAHADGGKGAAGQGRATASEGLTRAEGFQILVRTDSNNDSQTLRVGRVLDDQDLPLNKSFQVTVPMDAFVHSKVDAVIKLVATLADGSALPPWVEFDAAKGIFRGVPPSDYEGVLEVVVTARDEAGNLVSQRFRIRVGDGAVGKVALSEQLRAGGSHARHAERMNLVKVARAAALAKRAA